ncbi:helix-turn-helix domain-containing protein [Secundilactobacillus kimchicus]|uniref:helix-turn-helix domain-containing protein n=1 Tax=Secundilactobacillus kimchicus TaxID=528209 RepID=UPI0024A80C68|nr:helix-turn-helix transcriptional regulator [Secundilactobacillus kimchicus]
MIGDNVKRLRRAKNYSQIDLSKLSGVSQTTISDVENNLYTPNIKKIIQLAKTLNVDVNELLANTDKEMTK